ncbi:MAG: hypothetical protein E7062_07650 [Spirochaetaceae bacterium]|nr:hypothetical protein [Spirochaetaceae bacterium]
MIIDLDIKQIYAENLNTEISSVYTSDLLSDVLANCAVDSLLVTVQAHLNTVAVAYEKKCIGIIVCNNKEISEEMKAACSEYKIALFLTHLNQFEVSGFLFNKINYFL